MCKAGNHRKLNLHAVSRPPTGHVQTGIELLKGNYDAVRLCSSGENIVIGDMNVDLLKLDRYTRSFQQLADACTLRQIITDPTRFSGFKYSLIDHNYTDIHYINCKGTLRLDISDHRPTFLVKKKGKKLSSIRRSRGTVL